MRARPLILVATLLIIAIQAWLTVAVAMSSGISVLTLVSLLVVVILAFGIVGALRDRPHD